MHISLDWVNELVNIQNVNLNFLIEKLTLGGFEVEEILELKVNKKKQIVLDISATANRADSLSIKGISKEIAALINKPSKISNYEIKNLESKILIENAFQESKKSSNCSTLIAVTIDNLIDITVPKWVKEKLLCSGIKPLNNLFDFQHYILLETGYPFEFYDLEKIYEKLNSSEFNLFLKYSNNETVFSASNNVPYTLNQNIVILQANNVPLSIAGIIAHKDVFYTNQSKSLLIEGSIFNSKKIRQESRFLKLRTDRSARYEKGLNNSHLIEALYRLISLLKISNPNLICKIHTTSQIQEKQTNNILLKYENIIEILGPIKSKNNLGKICLLPIQISQYLKRLDLNFIFNQEKLTWEVKISKSRINDIEREIDLIEEIGRLNGFNNFVSNLPNIDQIGNEDFSYKTRKKITTCFLNEGFNELIQYSLETEKTQTTIKLINPLLIEYSNLRTSLLPSLVKTVSENFKQSDLLLEGFEYGHVFSGDIDSHYVEKEVISGIFGGIKLKSQWSESPKNLSWFEGKGKIEEILKKLNILVYWKNSNIEIYKTILHPYRTTELFLINGISLGIFGQIHPFLAKKRNVSSELLLFEFNFELLKIQLQNTKLPLYHQYSMYPKIIKDLSFILDQSITYEQIKKTILQNGTNFLKNVKLLDEYRGNSIPKNQTSLCIQLTFQSNKKTLVTEEVENIIKKLKTILIKQYQIIARD